MAKNNKNRAKVNKEVQDLKEEVISKPTVEEGNYVIEVISGGEVIKKVVAVKSAINITKLNDGGLTVDLI